MNDTACFSCTLPGRTLRTPVQPVDLLFISPVNRP